MRPHFCRLRAFQDVTTLTDIFDSRVRQRYEVAVANQASDEEEADQNSSHSETFFPPAWLLLSRLRRGRVNLGVLRHS